MILRLSILRFEHYLLIVDNNTIYWKSLANTIKIRFNHVSGLYVFRFCYYCKLNDSVVLANAYVCVYKLIE